MNKYRYWIAGFFLIILASLLALTIKDQIRDSIAEPIFYILSMAVLLFDSLPQQLVWGVLIMVSIVIYTRSLILNKIQPRVSMKPGSHYKGHVETWTHWIEMAQMGDIFKQRLARELGDLVLETIAHREQLEKKETRQLIRDGKIKVPLEIFNLINTKPPESKLSVNPFINFVQRLNKNGHASLQELNLDGVFQYLEAELEVNYD